MNKETILFVVLALFVGVISGVIFTNAKNEKAAGQSTFNPASAPSVNYQQEIKTIEAVLAKEPNNRQAWVKLGHNYYDSGDPMKAIEAYDKALELDGNDPDILTDQGTMYRRVGLFDKAIANFIEANKQNPQHLNSLFNMGIVYSQDLGDKIKAEEAWNRYLELNPTGQGAEKVRTMIDHMKNGHG
jgi:tetratricopeptide (TPR) repeat protein